MDTVMYANAASVEDTKEPNPLFVNEIELEEECNAIQLDRNGLIENQSQSDEEDEEEAQF